MSLNDLFEFSLQNLIRRRGRTVLTVLGITIGCCAIIINISLGVGMSVSQEKRLSEMGDLTVINIYNYGGRDNMGKDIKLTDKVLAEIEALPHVIAITPIKSYLDGIGLRINAGRNSQNDRFQISYANFVGMRVSEMETFGFRLKTGSFIAQNQSGIIRGKTIKVLVGEAFAYEFMDTKKQRNNMISSEKDTDGQYINQPFIDMENDKIYLTAVVNGDNGEEKTYQQQLEIVGVLKEDMSKGYETIAGFFIDINDLSQFENEAKQKLQIKRPNQRNNHDNGYERVNVKVDGIGQVEFVQNTIKEMGFETNSMDDIRRSMEDEVKERQKTLLGYGAISLLVATVGIANTMVMSVNERKKEIGVMKVIGCKISDILRIFLIEAGFIGFIGGIAGVIISCFISIIMNMTSSEVGLSGLSLSAIWDTLVHNPSPVSKIPLWLVMASACVSILIGVISGIYPACQAVKVSALEALKN